MIIRPVEPQDLTQLLTLCREHANYEQLPFVETGQIRRWKTAFFTEPSSLFGWVCDTGGSVPLAGYLTATVDYSTWTARRFVYLDCLFLQPLYRGKGLGRQLMAALNTFAVGKDCSAIEWQTPPTNEVGLSFYRAIGAHERTKIRFNLPVTPEVTQ